MAVITYVLFAIDSCKIGWQAILEFNNYVSDQRCGYIVFSVLLHILYLLGVAKGWWVEIGSVTRPWSRWCHYCEVPLGLTP